MANKYSQPSIAGATRFSKSPMADVQFSRMRSNPKVFTTFNAGDIVPLACWEVLPHDTFSVGMNYVTRLSSAVIKPTMGTMQIDYYAYFVQNRVVNESWKNVQGENTSGYWTAPEVELAPLYPVGTDGDVSIPVGSVADYYGFPTQRPIKAQHLQQMHDLKFRGYLEIYNTYFRDQNYQPPIPYSKLNVYNGFLQSKGSHAGFDSRGAGNMTIPAGQKADGSYPAGAIQKELYGDGINAELTQLYSGYSLGSRLTTFSALDKPLKANKLHDAFTSVLPSPQKGADVYFGIGETAGLAFDTYSSTIPFESGNGLRFATSQDITAGEHPLKLIGYGAKEAPVNVNPSESSTAGQGNYVINGTNLYGIVDLSNATGISVNELRTAIATQSVYETLARSGSRYLSTLRAFFEIEAESPFADIPEELGHLRKELDIYQVAQTSASEEGNTPQGDLAGFGYTAAGGHLFTKTFLEHGYVHIFAVVRHRNVYTTMLAPDNFRRSTLDFYLPQLANIGEQPIRLATLNPFIADEENMAIGFQEAWWEYRYQPDTISGEFRTGLNNGLDIWHLGDPFDVDFTHVNGDWLKSNSQEVLDRTLAVTSVVNGQHNVHQYIGMFAFEVDKQRPMPTYSVPGLDTI